MRCLGHPPASKTCEKACGRPLPKNDPPMKKAEHNRRSKFKLLEAARQEPPPRAQGRERGTPQERGEKEEGEGRGPGNQEPGEEGEKRPRPEGGERRGQKPGEREGVRGTAGAGELWPRAMTERHVPHKVQCVDGWCPDPPQCGTLPTLRITQPHEAKRHSLGRATERKHKATTKVGSVTLRLKELQYHTWTLGGGQTKGGNEAQQQPQQQSRKEQQREEEDRRRRRRRKRRRRNSSKPTCPGLAGQPSRGPRPGPRCRGPS